MSGFEIVGVIFGVLPLLIEVGKTYSKSPVHKAISRKPYDEKLADFYQTFWWELSELKIHISTLVESIPGISEEKRGDLLDTSRASTEWHDGSAAAMAFDGLLASIDQDRNVEVVMKKVLKLLDKLIKDETLDIKAADVVSCLRLSLTIWERPS